MVEIDASDNNNNTYIHTVASGQPPSEGWRPGAETCVFARTSSLFGVYGKHTLPQGPTFLLIVPAPTMTPYSHISPTGRQPLALFRTICRPDGILADVDQVKSSLSTPAQLAPFLAASSPHSQSPDWLQAMPVSSCRGVSITTPF